MMPQPSSLKPDKFNLWHEIGWDKSRDLAVMATPPTPEVDGNSFKPGENVKIRLNSNQGVKDIPFPFVWTLPNPGPGASGTLVPDDKGMSATLTLPTKESKLANIAIAIHWDGKRVGTVSFDNVDGNWKPAKQPESLHSLYLRRKSLPVSSRRFSVILAIIAALLAYLGISASVYLFNQRKTNGKLSCKNWRQYLKYLNPVVLTSGPYGKASLSRLQLLWFTIVILSLLVYLLSLTGDLSDLPASILGLLGISAAGTVGTLGVDGARNRLDFVNWQWLNDQGWIRETDQYGDYKEANKKAGRKNW